MSTHTPGYEITFDGFGFNDAKDPYKRRLATLPATWKDEGARQQFGHEVVRAVNTHAQLLEALKALLCEPMAERTVDAAKRAIRAAQGKE